MDDYDGPIYHGVEVDDNFEGAIYHVKLVGGGGSGDKHNLGYYATQSALEEAHPTAEAGDYAIVGSTDTVWVWDTDNSEWTDSGAKSPTYTAGTGISITNNEISATDPVLVNKTTATTSILLGNRFTANALTASEAIAISWDQYKDINVKPYSVVVGVAAYSSGLNGIAIGHHAGATFDNAIAIGNGVRASAVGAIQLGKSSNAITTNSDPNTFKVGNANGNFEIMSADGTVPTARLADTTNAAQGQVLTLDSNLNAVWQAGGGGSSYTAGNGISITNNEIAVTDPVLVNKATSTGGLGILNQLSVGQCATTVGYDSSSAIEGGIAIGYQARVKQKYGIAIGCNVWADAAHAIQIGNQSEQSGTAINSDANTFKVANQNGNFEIMSADGTVPTARLTKVNTTITLTAAGWSNSSQTVSVSGITSTGVVFVSPDPTDQADYTTAGILCTSQATDSLTFTCDTTPSSDIDVVVVQM